MLLTEDIDRREDMAAIEGLAEARIGAIAFAPAMFGDRRETARLEAVEVVAGQDVDHTRDRIRAIDRRGAGLEHLDLPDHRQRPPIAVAGRHRAPHAPGSRAAAAAQPQRPPGARTSPVYGTTDSARVHLAGPPPFNTTTH